MIFLKSISERNESRAAQMVGEARSVELRADMMGADAEQVAELVRLAERAVVTHHAAPTEAEEVYTAAIEAGAWAIDIASERQADFAERIAARCHRAGTKLIISTHYPDTPSLEVLIRQAEQNFERGADIVKLITTAHNTAEAIVPIKLYGHFDPSRLVAFAMGAEGSFTRRLSLLQGAPYTYVAPSATEATAAGQPTEEALRAILAEGVSMEGFTLPESVTIPASKSEAQRAIVAATLARGTSKLRGAHLCGDTEAAIALARTLGAKAKMRSRVLTIEGAGYEHIASHLSTNITTLNVGESALLTRLTLPLVATLLREGSVVIGGRGTLLGRSFADDIALLERYGAEIKSNDGRLPIAITRGATFPTDIEIGEVSSSQTISGLMMVSALIDRDEMTHIEVRRAVSRPYIALTADVMERFGAIVSIGDTEPLTIDIEPEPFEPSEMELTTDWSSAGYFAAAYAIAQSLPTASPTPYTLRARMGSWQGDEVLMVLLSVSGAHIDVGKEHIGFLPSPTLSAITYDATHTPDLIPTLAVVALFAQGESVIGGLGRLVGKESNRTLSIVENLVAIGADVRIEGDSLHIRGGAPLRPAPIRTYGDHRIAMAFAVAALFMTPRPTLDNTECVAKSFPQFFDKLQDA